MSDVLGAVLATALVALLVGYQPFNGRRRYRRLVEQLPRDPTARLRHYRRGLAGEWAAVAVVLVVGLLAGRDAASIGFRGSDDAGTSWGLVVEVAVLLAISTPFLRRRRFRNALRRQARGFIALLPTTRTERLTFAALAVTAGICEEILFRGFLFGYVRWVWPDAADAAVVTVTSIAFGFVHLYQGRRGVILTALVGAMLGSLTVSSGSLLPAITVHMLIDLRILALPDLSTPSSDDESGLSSGAV